MFACAHYLFLFFYFLFYFILYTIVNLPGNYSLSSMCVPPTMTFSLYVQHTITTTSIVSRLLYIYIFSFQHALMMSNIPEMSDFLLSCFAIHHLLLNPPCALPLLHNEVVTSYSESR